MTEPFVVLVCGGRNFCDLVRVFSALDLLHKTQGPITQLISGAARGADTHALEWAESRGVERLSMPADWNTHGMKAGFIRNQEMLAKNPDYVVAFPGGRGTNHMVN